MRNSLKRWLMMVGVLFGVLTPVVQGPGVDAFSDALPGTTAEAVGKTVAAGNGFYCAINAANAVQCWGDNQSGALGQGTTGGSVTAANRVTVVGVTTTHISGGNAHTCAITQPGDVVKCWGAFQVTTGTSNNYSPPRTATKVQKSGGGDLAGIVDISSYDEMDCALDSTGVVWCWGYLSGGLGVDSSTTAYRPAAVQVPLVGTVRSISVGSGSACALMVDGTVKCWGQGANGQLTKGSSGFNNLPTTVIDEATGQPLTGVLTMTSGTQTHCALLAANRVTCWGFPVANSWGAAATTNVPHTLESGERIDSISLAYRTLIILTDRKRAVSVGASGTSAIQNDWRPVSGARTTIGVGRSSTSLAKSCAVFEDRSLECEGSTITGFESYVPPPSPPTIPAAVAGDGQATITVAAGDGPTPTSYRVTAQPGGAVCDVTDPATSMSCVVAGLTNGSTYTFSATASSSVGTSGPSNTVSLTVGLPATPAEPDISIGDGAITVTPQPVDGGGTPEFFTITITTTTEPVDTFTCTVVPPAVDCTISGLRNNTATDDIGYTVEVTATNDAGTSPPSDGVDVQVGPPGRPPAPDVLDVGPGSATVGVRPPAGGGKVSYYTVTATSTTAPFTTHTCTVTPPDTSCTLTGLTDGLSYDVTVSATNAAGASASSDPATFTLGAPATPSAPNLEPGGGQATVEIVPGLDGGLVTQYIVTAEPGGHRCIITPPAMGCVLTGLTNGVQYTVTTSAVNGLGESLGSAASTVTPSAPRSADAATPLSSPTATIDDAQSADAVALSDTVPPAVGSGELPATGLDNDLPFSLAILMVALGALTATAAWRRTSASRPM